MTEPVTVAAAGAKWMGMNFLTLIAGFAGGVISLSFIKDLSKLQGVVAVITGLSVAAFLAPLPAPWTADFLVSFAGNHMTPADWANKVEAAYGFLFGITGMTLVPGFIVLATKFREDPWFVLRFFAGRFNRDKGGES